MKIITIILILLTYSCTNKEEIEYLDYTTDTLIIDGNTEKCWNNTKSNELYYYYGQEAEDSLDFNSYYKVLQNSDDIYIFVSVCDQVKYSHPKPIDILDLKLWNPGDYDRVNLSFDFDNDGKDDFGVSLNYGLDSIFTNNISQSLIKAVLVETTNGYNTEFKIPLRFFKMSIIKFNVVVTDHDKKFAKDGFDVYGRYESMYGIGCIYKRR